MATHAHPETGRLAASSRLGAMDEEAQQLLEALREHRDEVDRVAERHGVSNLRMSAGGTLLVHAPGLTYFDLAEFSLGLEDVLGMRVLRYTPDSILQQPGHSTELDEAIAV